MIDVLRSYSDKSAQPTEPTFDAVFGRASDTDKQHPLFTQQTVAGFSKGGAIALPFTVPAGQSPVDVLINSGAAHNIAGAGAFVKANLSKTPGDYGDAKFLPPGSPIGTACFKIGHGTNQQRAYPELHPGETWYLNAVAQDSGPFWLECHPTKR